MLTDQQELLRTQNSAGNQDNSNSSEQLIERKQKPGTPFWLIRKEEHWWWVFGQFHLNQEPLPSEEIAEDWLQYNMWNVVLQMVIGHSIVAEKI